MEKKYAGSVTVFKRGYQFRLKSKGRELSSRYFSESSFGSMEEAKNQAEDHRKAESVRFGLTKEVAIPQIKAPGIVGIDMLRYLGGLFDGDGSFRVHKKNTTWAPIVALSQSHDQGPPPVLIRVQTLLGGALDKQREGDNRRRDAYELKWYSLYDCGTVTKALEPFLVLKRPQARRLLQFIANFGASSKKDKYRCEQEMSAAKENYSAVEVAPDDLTIQFIAGLFDADGSIVLSKKGALQVSITKHSSENMRKAISVHLGYGSVSSGVWIAYGQHAEDFLERIAPYSIVKRSQVDEALRYRASRREDVEETRECLKKLKKE